MSNGANGARRSNRRTKSLETTGSSKDMFALLSLRRSLELVQQTEPPYLKFGALMYLAVGTMAALWYFFDRSSVLAKASSVPPLVGLVFDYKRKSQTGWSPCSILIIALLLHSFGDVLIHQFGVIPSMPAFLLGHLFYCVAFLRGADLSLSNFTHFTLLKQMVMGLAMAYAYYMWSVLSPSFDTPIKPVLLSYVLAIAVMFELSMFSRSKLIVVGSFMYLFSDSLIAFAAFVYRDSQLVRTLDLNLSWPVYFVGQCFITFGSLNAFSKVEFVEPRKNGPEFIAGLALFTLAFVLTFISVRIVWTRVLFV